MPLFILGIDGRGLILNAPPTILELFVGHERREREMLDLLRIQLMATVRWGGGGARVFKMSVHLLGWS